MIPLTVEEVRALAPGELEGAGEVTGVQIDSRRVRPGDLFVAIGLGAEFRDDARDRGAAATLVPDDPFAALAAIAGAVRERSEARVVGITGSTGKTSTKDILAALCAPVARTVAAEGSFNNELGVPLTLCRLEPDTELCIVEMGMRGFGQIADLCAYARPEVGVITAVGPVHLALVGSVEGVARSKAELLEALPVAGVAVVPEDAKALDRYLRNDLIVLRVAPVDVELLADGAHVAFGGRRIRFNVSSRHQAQNAFTALHAYAALGLPVDRADEGAARVELSQWRGERLSLPGGGFVINDAYNANPTSVRAALLDLVERAEGRRALAILGGMAELGKRAPAYHEEIASLARELGIELLAVGDLARWYGADRWEPDPQAALAAAQELVQPEDAVLVKASRAVGLEGIAPALTNHAR